MFAPAGPGQLADVELPMVVHSPQAASGSFRAARARALEAFEKGYVEEMLRRTAGNVTRAARLADKDRRVFGRLMKRHNVRREQF
jgi:DNA-binding NtrC family response regulator